MERNSPTPDLPLSGVTVLDFSRYLPGPYCTLQLAHLGAQVTVIERPPDGDPMRAIPPLAADGESLFFKALSQKKESVFKDLTVEADMEWVCERAREADVVVETFRPGVARRLGIDHETLSVDNPGLVSCSISGYGQDGPWAQVPGHDPNYMAASGLLDQTGGPDRPVLAPVPLADISAAVHAATAICAALYERERTGRGRFIDMSMTEASLALQTHVVPAADTREAQRAKGPLNGDLACFDIYECADGRFLSVSSIEPHFFARLCTLLGCEELTPDQLDPSSQDAIRRELSLIFAGKPASHWQELLAHEETCVCAVMSLSEALAHPQLVARGAVTSTTVVDSAGDEHTYPLAASPYVLDGTRT